MAQRDIGTLRTRLSFEGDDVNKSLEGFRRDLRGLRSEMNLARSKGREYTQSLKGMREQSLKTYATVFYVYLIVRHNIA